MDSKLAVAQNRQSQDLIRPGSVIFEDGIFRAGLASKRYAIAPGQVNVVLRDGRFWAGMNEDTFGSLILTSRKIALFLLRRLEADGVNIVAVVTNTTEMTTLHANVIPRYASLNQSRVPLKITNPENVGQYTVVDENEAGTMLAKLQGGSSIASLGINQIANPSIGEDIFCRVVRNNKDAMVYERNGVVATVNASPSSLAHTLVMPYEHYKGLVDVPDSVLFEIGKVSFDMAMSQLSGLIDRSGNTHWIEGPAFITIDHGKEAGQTIEHLHVHMRNMQSLSGDRVEIDLNPDQSTRKSSTLLSDADKAEVASLLRHPYWHIGWT